MFFLLKNVLKNIYVCFIVFHIVVDNLWKSVRNLWIKVSFNPSKCLILLLSKPAVYQSFENMSTPQVCQISITDLS